MSHSPKSLLFRTICIVMLSSVFLSSSMSAKAESATSGSEEALLNSIDLMYSTYQTLEQAIRATDLTIKTVHHSHSAVLKEVQAKLKTIGVAKTGQLSNEVKQTEARWASTLAMNKGLGQKLKSANARKDKKAATLLRLQINRLKPAVQRARLEIKNKKVELQNAKKNAANQTKRVRSILAEASPMNKQVTLAKKSIAALKKEKAAAWKSFNAAVKEGNGVLALSSITVATSKLRNVTVQQANVLSAERKIAEIVNRAKSLAQTMS